MVSPFKNKTSSNVECTRMVLPPHVLTLDIMKIVPLLYHQATAVFVGALSNKMRRSPSPADLKMLYQSQLNSFEKQSQKIESSENSEIGQIRRDPAFVHLFASVLNQFQIVEFYIRDENGSFLLVDKHGAQFVLIVKYDDDLDRDEAGLRKAGLSPELCDKLKTRELMLSSLKDQKLSMEYIGMRLGPPVVVNGIRRYYSAVAPRLARRDIN